MTIFRFALIRSFRSPTLIVLLCVLPLVAVWLPVNEWNGMPIGLQYFGIILFFSGSRLVHLVLEDRVSRTALRIAAAPITTLRYLWQHMLAYTMLLLGQILVMIVLGVWLHGDFMTSPLLLAVVYLFFAVSVLGFSLAWCSLFRSREASITILFGLIIIMAMLGGMVWPIHIMPEPLQRAAMLLPTYWLTEALHLIASGARLIDLGIPLAVMALLSIACLIAGSRIRLT